MLPGLQVIVQNASLMSMVHRLGHRLQQAGSLVSRSDLPEKHCDFFLWFFRHGYRYPWRNEQNSVMQDEIFLSNMARPPEKQECV